MIFLGPKGTALKKKKLVRNYFIPKLINATVVFISQAFSPHSKGGSLKNTSYFMW